jgi:type VI secretion system protein VasD
MSIHGSLVSGIACALLLESCASKPPPKPPPQAPAEIRATLSASPDVNPDPNGRASPVVVRIYQLRGDSEFNGTDFFSLYDKEKETLAANLISREERTLIPGQQIELQLLLAPDSRFLGAIAALRDIQASHWRAIAAVPQTPPSNKKPVENRLSIRIEKDLINVSISPSN